VDVAALLVRIELEKRGVRAAYIMHSMNRYVTFLSASLVALTSVTACDGDGGDSGADSGADGDGDVDGDADGGLDGDVEEPDCAAEGEARCWYVTVDGDDGEAGTIDAPFKTFQAAVTQAGPGDFIYARGGTYGQDNAMVAGVSRDNDSHPASSCPDGQVLADEYCFSDRYAMIVIHDFSGWASETPGYEVGSGEEGQPITVRNFPGEHPVLDVTGWSQQVVEVGLEAFWTIQGFEMIGGKVNIGGPYNIFVVENELHGIYDWEQPGEWSGVPDAQHFGAVTTLSRENYYGFDGGGTGRIVIRDNEIYHCPQAFFFKNPMAGPIEIHDNVIHEVGSIGFMGAANVELVGNLVYDVRSGFWAVGNGGYEDERLHAIAGQDATIVYNTFVGLDSLLGIRCGTGHTVTNNVFFGLDSQTDGAGWNTPSFIAKSESFTDELALEDSILQAITSDDNCFFSPYDDFQFVARYMPGEVEHYDHADALTLFGFDGSSSFYIEDDPTAVFRDPDAQDFRLLTPGDCPGRGYEARPTP
jgi:hypothetical protein